MKLLSSDKTRWMVKGRYTPTSLWEEQVEDEKERNEFKWGKERI